MNKFSLDSYIYKWLFLSKLKALSNPVFIVGCGHSGTSIILRVLGAHSNFCTIEDESRLFYKSHRELICTLLYWSSKLEETDKKRIIEKTPEHIYCIDKIFKIFPNANIICMVRDGRDVACSHKHRNTIQFGMQSWVEASIAIRPYLHHRNIKIIKLEELVANPVTTLTQALKFTGEQFESSILEYHKQPAYYYDASIKRPQSVEEGDNHRAYRNWQINQPLFISTERWKTEMTSEEKSIFKNNAQEHLQFWGYEKSDNW